MEIYLIGNLTNVLTVLGFDLCVGGMNIQQNTATKCEINHTDTHYLQ